MTTLLKKWHWIHTWSTWEDGEVQYVAYPWTEADSYAHKQIIQTRHCLKCGIKQANTIWL